MNASPAYALAIAATLVFLCCRDPNPPASDKFKSERSASAGNAGGEALPSPSPAKAELRPTPPPKFPAFLSRPCGNLCDTQARVFVYQVQPRKLPESVVDCYICAHNHLDFALRRHEMEQRPTTADGADVRTSEPDAIAAADDAGHYVPSFDPACLDDHKKLLVRIDWLLESVPPEGVGYELGKSGGGPGSEPLFFPVQEQCAEAVIPPRHGWNVWWGN